MPVNISRRRDMLYGTVTQGDPGHVTPYDISQLGREEKAPREFYLPPLKIDDAVRRVALRQSEMRHDLVDEVVRPGHLCGNQPVSRVHPAILH